MAKPSHLRTTTHSVIPTKSNEYARKRDEAEWIAIQKQNYHEARARQLLVDKKAKQPDTTGMSERLIRRLQMKGCIS